MNDIVIRHGDNIINGLDIASGSFQLSEVLCSSSQLKFGSCEASEFSIRVRSKETFINQKLDVTLTVKGVEYDFPPFTVVTDKPAANKCYKDLAAYDSMYDILNAEVSGWYNTLLPNTDSTVTLKQFRDSFFEHMGIAQEAVSLVNDSMTVEKTIEPSELSGKRVITSICELNGCFGHIGRDGKFQYIFLKEMSEGLYPHNGLYPRDGLYPRNEPADSYEISKSYYDSCQYEDFVTQKITKLQIRQQENDIGVIYGDGDNCYIVQDNFLVYGKSSEELQTIASNMFSIIKTVTYRPATVLATGNPVMSVGDGFRVHTNDKVVYSYVLKRTLKGIQSLRDTYEAAGVEKYSEKVNGMHKEIQQLKGKSNELTRTIEETRLQITDVEKGLHSEIVQTASGIRVEISQAESNAKAHTDSAVSIAESNAKKDTDNKLKSYSTTEQMNSAIQISADNINASVSEKITQTRRYVDDAAGTAENNAKADTTEKLKAYSTTTQMNSAIQISADNINLNVSEQITQTRQYADNAAGTAENNAKADITEKLKSYSTTSQMNSAIEQSADSINLSVSQKITETKSYADNKAAQAQGNAIGYTQGALQSYSTTSQMNSAIEIGINEIRAEVTERTSLYNEEINTLQGGMDGSINLSFFTGEAIIATQANKQCLYTNSGYSQDVSIPAGSYRFTYEWLRSLGLYIVSNVILENLTDNVVLYEEDLGYAWPDMDVWTKETFQFTLTKTSRIRFRTEFQTPSGYEDRENSLYLTNIAIYGTAQSVADAIGDVKKDLMSQSDILAEEIERATSVEVNLNSKIDQTANTIRSEVSANYETKSNAFQKYASLSSSIEQTASSISAKVSKDSIISEINQTAETVAIQASKIDLEGLVEADELVTKFASAENFNAAVARIETIESNYITANYVSSNYATIGNLNTTNANVSNLSASVANLNTVVASKIDASTVKADYMEVANWTSGGYIKANKINANDITTIIANANSISTGAITAQSYNGKTMNISDGLSLLGYVVSWKTKTIDGVTINYLGR